MKEIEYRAAVETDFPEIVSFHQLYFEAERSLKVLDWMINKNPAGKAIYVLALDKKQIIGTQCILPYWLKNSDGRLIISGKSEDTCIHPSYRGKGLFQHLYDAAVRMASGVGIHYIWGFTSAISPFRKSGFIIGPSFAMTIATNGIRSGYKALRKPGRFVRNAKLLAFLVKNSISVKMPSFLHIRLENPLKIESELIKLGRRSALNIVISKAYFSWRLWDNPYYDKVYCLTYREGRKLIGYVLFHLPGKVAYVIHQCIEESVSYKKRSLMLAAFTQKMFTMGAGAVKNWWIDLHGSSEAEKENWKEAGYGFVQSGSHFVWLPVNDEDALEWKGLNLTRLATLGTT